MDTTVEMKELLHRMTVELIGSCRFCKLISSDIHFKTPIYCTKFSGSSSAPLCLDIKTCLSCGEYKNRTID